jgi:hypothetical protein
VRVHIHFRQLGTKSFLPFPNFIGEDDIGFMMSLGGLLPPKRFNINRNFLP